MQREGVSVLLTAFYTIMGSAIFCSCELVCGMAMHTIYAGSCVVNWPSKCMHCDGKRRIGGLILPVNFTEAMKRSM